MCSRYVSRIDLNQPGFPIVFFELDLIREMGANSALAILSSRLVRAACELDCALQNVGAALQFRHSLKLLKNSPSGEEAGL